MKTNRRKLRALLEELTAREQFMQAMEKDNDNAGRHLDDLLAREQGYDSDLDKSFEEMVARIDRENELEDRLNQMSREEVGLSDDYVPSENIEFMRHKKAAEEALTKGDDEEFIHRYRMMVHHGRMFDKSNPDAWKTEPGVDRLMAAMNELESQASLFDFANSPVLRSLGIMENKAIKLSRRKLRVLLEEEAEKLSDEESAAAEKKIEDEGGALGKDVFVKTVNDVNPDVNYSEEEALRRAEASIEDFKLHVEDDVYTDEPQEINEFFLRRLIKEELERIGLYEKDSSIDERKRKKKSKKRKKKKSNLYPYVFGYGYHRDAEDYDYDIGGDFGGGFGDGGGGGE